MTSHFISYFSRRAESILYQAGLPTNQDSAVAASSSSSPPSDSGVQSELEEIVDGTGSGKEREGCAFCDIVNKRAEAFTVYEDEHTLAFLDILPIRPGHLLVIPKKHYARVSHLPDKVSAAIGRVLPSVSRALCAATNQPDFNIVSNQGHAQIVHHVHYHLVPAPLANTPLRSGWASVLMQRDELDEEEGAELAERIREELRKAKVEGAAKAKL